MKTPPIDNILPHLFTQMQNQLNISCKRHSFWNLSHLKLLMIPNQTTSLHHELWIIKKDVLIGLCTRNYATLNGFVNGVDGILKDYTKTLSKSLIWIHFQIPQIESTQDLKIHKHTKNSLDLTKIRHQLN